MSSHAQWDQLHALHGESMYLVAGCFISGFYSSIRIVLAVGRGALMTMKRRKGMKEKQVFLIVFTRTMGLASRAPW